MPLDPSWPFKPLAKVARLLPVARTRLEVIEVGATVVEAARRLQSGNELLVACTIDARMAGVVSKSDVISCFAAATGSDCLRRVVSAVMRRDVVSCVAEEDLHAVWLRMKTSGLKNIPVLNDDARPLGLLSARDTLELILEGTEEEETLMRDYVMGIGYR